MNKKKLLNRNIEQIDLGYLLSELWKHKILFFFILIIFSIVSFFFFTYQPKTNKISIKILQAKPEVFQEYFLLSREISKPLESFAQDYNGIFQQELLKDNNFEEFINQNNEIGQFKFNLKDKNFNIKSYFNEKISIDFIEIENKKIINNIYFIFEIVNPGDKILSEYIIFVKNITDQIFRKKIVSLTNIEIKRYKLYLNLATDILNFQNGLTLETYEKTPFLYGTQIVNLKIKLLEKISNNFEKINLNYTPILNKKSSINYKSLKIYIIYSLLLGLFFSSIVVFINSWIKNSYNTMRR